MTPAWPSESWWTSEPFSTHVTISMSRCGWLSNPNRGAIVSWLTPRGQDCPNCSRILTDIASASPYEDVSGGRCAR